MWPVSLKAELRKFSTVITLHFLDDNDDDDDDACFH